MTAFIRKMISALPTDYFFIRLAAGILFIILFIIILIGLSLYQSKMQYEKQAVISTQNLSQALDQNIQHVMDKTNNALLAMADEINRQIAAGGIDKQTLNAFIANQKERLLVADSLRMADAQGMVRYGTAVESASRTNIADRDHFTRPRDNPKPMLFINKPVITRIDKKWALPISRRLNRSDGSFAGIVYANVELKTFIDMFSLLNIGQKGTITLCDREMRIIARYPEPKGLGSTIGTKAVTVQIPKMIEAGQNTGTSHSRSAVDNIERIFSFREISPYPLYVIVARATTEYLSDWRQEVAKMVFIGLLFMAVILYFSQQIFIGWKSEKEAREELYRVNSELENRVVERTNEIAKVNEQLQAELTERKLAAEALKTALFEKEILLKEIHHRVKNNLMVVSSILQLQSGALDDKKAREALKECEQRVHTMAMIHTRIYKSKDLARINFNTYIGELVKDLSIAYKVNPDTVISVAVDDVSFNIDTAIPLSLILNELITNALKYAFPDKGKGEIHIAFKGEDDAFILTVGDNGTGFPEDIDYRNTDSLGLQLVMALVDQIDGAIEMERSGGTMFRITFNRAE